jgi:ferric-dicitrate binding protein FerR (iron transport regulator)
LPDGSTVWLNAASRLIYNKNFDAAIREVELTGEAYFDVGFESGRIKSGKEKQMAESE